MRTVKVRGLGVEGKPGSSFSAPLFICRETPNMFSTIFGGAVLFSRLNDSNRNRLRTSGASACNQKVQNRYILVTFGACGYGKIDSKRENRGFGYRLFAHLADTRIPGLLLRPPTRELTPRPPQSSSDAYAVIESGSPSPIRRFAPLRLSRRDRE